MKAEHEEIVEAIQSNCDSNRSSIISKCSKVKRVGLYFMVIVTMNASCDNNDKLIDLKSKVNRLQDNLEGVAENVCKIKAVVLDY